MQRTAAEAIISGQAKTQGEALAIAGYAPSVVRDRPKRTLDAIREQVRTLLEKRVPMETLAEHIAKGLNSKKPVVVMIGNGMSEVQMVDDPHANVKYATLLSQMLGLLVRHEESKVTHNVDIAGAISAARRRLKEPDVTAVVTHALPVSIESTDYATNASNPLGQSPNEDVQVVENPKNDHDQTGRHP
ncbi:MAG: hypothetical protein KGL39_14110 [Patescibacteria group bacterium]|nr:hypothetical protein [Patescibacteria group bacterium]